MLAILIFISLPEINKPYRIFKMKTKLNDAQLSLFNSLNVGDVVEGKVQMINRFGAFIRYQSLTGLLHKNDVTYARMTSIDDFIKENQKIKVKVLKIDYEEQQLQFGLKQLTTSPWERVSKLNVGETAVGTVVAIHDYGAFLSIANGVEGLLHKSEIPDLIEGQSVASYFNIDEVYEVTIIKIDNETKKLSFSLKF